MKIKTKFSDVYIEVFAIYWLQEKTYFYGLSSGYDGLLAYDADDVTVTDPVLHGDYIYLNEGIFYRPLVDENILDELVEADPAAFRRFLEIRGALSE